MKEAEGWKGGGVEEAEGGRGARGGSVGCFTIGVYSTEQSTLSHATIRFPAICLLPLQMLSTFSDRPCGRPSTSLRPSVRRSVSLPQFLPFVLPSIRRYLALRYDYHSIRISKYNFLQVLNYTNAYIENIHAHILQSRVLFYMNYCRNIELCMNYYLLYILHRL